LHAESIINFNSIFYAWKRFHSKFRGWI
jgi:hypothetical protein